MRATKHQAILLLVLTTILSLSASADSIPEVNSFDSVQGSSPLTSYYDEQLGVTLRENFTALSINVTAVRQCAIEGDGPAYLLNGLSDRGYWYQVGLASNWGTPGQPWLPGFVALYAVFAPNGTEVFPRSGNVVWKSMPVNQGDIVSLRLYVSGGNVVMQVLDPARGASNSTSYTAAGATRFVGSPNGNSGFFTGPMTEEYHASPYYGDGRTVNYAWYGMSPSSGWNWIGEFNTTTNKWLFYDRSLANYTGRPQLQYLRSNGTVVASNSQTFVSGSLLTGQDCPASPSPPPTSPPALWQTSTFLVLIALIALTALAVTAIAWQKTGHKQTTTKSPGPNSSI